MTQRIANGGNVAQNRKARFNYSIEDEIEAGLVLMGTEVKSMRAGQANINDAFAVVQSGEIWLHNAYIAEYPPANQFNHEARRPRKVLLHKRQMEKMIGKLKVKGATIVPLALFFNKKGFAKVMLGMARGKKEYEKRDTIKDREWQKEQGRIMRDKG